MKRASYKPKTRTKQKKDAIQTWRWYAYDLDMKRILREYVEPGIESEISTNKLFSATKFKSGIISALKEYCKRYQLKYTEEMRILAKPLIIDSADNAYFIFLQWALTFYDPVKIPEFLTYQYLTFQGNKYASQESFIGHIEFLTYEHIRKFSHNDNFFRRKAIMDWVRALKQEIVTNPPKKIQVKFNGEVRHKVLKELSEYIAAAQLDKLADLLSDNPVTPYIIFHGEAGIFCEFIKRLFYNKKITSSQADLEIWIQRYFSYYHKKVDDVRFFSSSRVHDFISKNKDRIAKKKRIGEDWLPYFNPAQRRQIK